MSPRISQAVGDGNIKLGTNIIILPNHRWGRRRRQFICNDEEHMMHKNPVIETQKEDGGKKSLKQNLLKINVNLIKKFLCFLIRAQEKKNKLLKLYNHYKGFLFFWKKNWEFGALKVIFTLTQQPAIIKFNPFFFPKKIRGNPLSNF